MIPKTLGGCVDRLYTLKQMMVDVNKKLEALDTERKDIEKHLIAKLPSSGSTGIMGRLAEARVKMEVVPSVKDWNVFQAHILKTKDFAFLERRAAKTHCRALWDAGETIPGVEQFPYPKLSLTKAK